MPVLAHAYVMTSAELRELLEVAIANRQIIARYWDEHFGD